MRYSTTRFLILSSFLVISALLGMAHRQVRAQEARLATLRAAPVKAPGGLPAPGQAAIDRALALYHISVPNNTDHPTYDAELADRGLTSVGGMAGIFGGKFQVTIGPAAFTSWALLASTLAHEIEGHCHQKVGLVMLLQKENEAEREAYQLELNGAKRFGLSSLELADISEVKEFYYPLKNRSESRLYRLFLSAKSSTINHQK